MWTSERSGHWKCAFAGDCGTPTSSSLSFHLAPEVSSFAQPASGPLNHIDWNL
jgi:hypothetical protein